MIHLERIDDFLLACLRSSVREKYRGKTWRVQIGIPFVRVWSFAL